MGEWEVGQAVCVCVCVLGGWVCARTVDDGTMILDAVISYLLSYKLSNPQQARNVP